MPNTITQIGTNAFSGCTYLASVSLSSGLVNIQSSSFYCCSSLASIVIPEGVKRLYDSAFSNCSSLTSVVLPNTLTEIDYGCFSNCTSLTSIIIPSSVRCLYGNAFNRCSSMTSVVLNEGLKYIDYNCFYNCRLLTSITIPASVYYIGSGCFNACSSLTSVVFKQLNGWQHNSGGDSIYKELIEVPEMAAQQLVNNNYDWFNKYVPSSINKNYYYTNISIGDTVSTGISLYPSASIAPITYESSNEAVATVDENGVVTGLDNGVVTIDVESSGLHASVEIRVGDPETDGTFLYYKVNENEYGIATASNYSVSGDIVIPSTFNGKSVTKIMCQGFAYCYNLTSVFIPSTIIEIGTLAFCGMSNLKEVKLESAVPPQMGSNVFSGTWDYSDFHIVVPFSSIPTYKAINAEYWQDYAIDNIVGYNPDGE